MRSLSRVAAAVATLVLAACQARSPAAPDLPPPPAHANGQALWTIVHGKCVRDEQASGKPDPCAQVDLAGGVDHGWALLKDLHGVAQYLLMPTIDITGIEDPRVIAPGAPNYFAVAWRDRTFVEAKFGKPIPREDLGVSVNSLYGRSQDLLHLHIDCLSPETAAALAADTPKVGPRWTRTPLTLHGHPYYAMRLAGADPAADPFRLLAEGVPGAAKSMGAWTLVMAAVRLPGGAPGFILLAGRADPRHGDFASGEELQDHDCAIAKPA
jgi:CDP-diacylglycerol pyrophosphatase